MIRGTQGQSQNSAFLFLSFRAADNTLERGVKPVRIPVALCAILLLSQRFQRFQVQFQELSKFQCFQQFWVYFLEISKFPLSISHRMEDVRLLVQIRPTVCVRALLVFLVVSACSLLFNAGRSSETSSQRVHMVLHSMLLLKLKQIESYGNSSG